MQLLKLSNVLLVMIWGGERRLQMLFTAEGERALEAAMQMAPREEDFLPAFTRLSKEFPAELARAALEIAILRREAAGKFPFAERMFFTREALEQASSWEVCTYRAERYRGFERLADLSCSIGSDTLALAKISPTVGIDYDWRRLTLARANARALWLAGRAGFAQADLRAGLPLDHKGRAGRRTALFFDPGRRRGGRRMRSVRAYAPPLEVVERWLPYFPALGVKISPGVDLRETAAYEAEVEFISLRGQLKEAVLWFGPLRSASRRATVLPEAVSLTERDLPQYGEGEGLGLSEPLGYLYEPDPAILRAGLVAVVGRQLGARQLDAEIAYLTGEEWVETRWARGWRIEGWMPFSLKRLRAALRERGVGRVTVKKRGSPLTPEALIRDLRLKGNEERVVFVTRLKGKPIVVVCFVD